MPQITSFRLLFSSANHYSASPLFFLSPKPNPLPSFSLYSKKPRHLLFTVFASSSYSRKPKRTYTNNNNSSPPFFSRKNSTLRKTEEREKGGAGLAMEEKADANFNSRSGSGEAVYNRKRAEGRDGNNRPRKLERKVQKLNPVNTISYVQILGTGLDTQDTSPSVLLFFDKQRIIFNAGEGLQRFCTEHKIKLSKIDHIFLTRVCSETTGGLPGLLLTLAGIGEKGLRVNVHGPSDLTYLVNAMKSFIPRDAMVDTNSFGHTLGTDRAAVPAPRKLDDPLVLINNEVVKISAILLQPNLSEVCAPLKENSSEFVSKPGDLSVVYICELPEIKGKFDPKKASALGLRAGPKYRELQNGISVKSDYQDRMVHPSDVLGPSVPGPIVLLVDCPTSSHLQELLSVDSLNEYYTDKSGSQAECCKSVNCIIHLSPASVTETSDYQKWMSRFGASQHILAGHEKKNIEVPILKSSARLAARLNYLCPQFFPAPGFWSLEHLKHLPSSPKELSEGLFPFPCGSIPAENLLKFHLRPFSQLGLDKSGIPSVVSPSEIIDELMSEIPEIVDASEEVTRLLRGDEETSVSKSSMQGSDVVIEEPWLRGDSLPECLEGVSRDNMEIVLLGTGSSQPSKYRNVSAVFINLFTKGSILFDCGEGTLGQLIRRFGIEGADDAVKALRCIWISHIHADHHMGLARILSLRRNLLKGVPHEPLVVVGPLQLKRFLDAYQRLEDLDMQYLDCIHTTEASLEAFELYENGSTPGSDSSLFSKGTPMQSYRKRPGSPIGNAVALPVIRTLKKVLAEAGLEALVSFPVVHCPEAYGVVLKAADRINKVGKRIPGWKIVYSGDTRPCPQLIKASRGATVLIHEATFEDSMVDEAIARNHSTTAEAVEVGDSAGVYRIILTHFSQRYPKIPIFDERHMHKTCIAFDMMSVNLADLHALPRVLPYLKLLFKDEMLVDEPDDVDDVDVVSEAA